MCQTLWKNSLFNPRDMLRNYLHNNLNSLKYIDYEPIHVSLSKLDYYNDPTGYNLQLFVEIFILSPIEEKYKMVMNNEHLFLSFFSGSSFVDVNMNISNTNDMLAMFKLIIYLTPYNIMLTINSLISDFHSLSEENIKTIKYTMSTVNYAYT